MKDSTTNHTAEASPLGQSTQYASHYDPSLLFPIPRAASREQLGIAGALPFKGVDIWTGYELSWLNTKGKPQVAVAEFSIPCDSPCIIESKSFKLYLNSLNQTAFANSGEVQQRIQQDLSVVAGSMVDANLQSLGESNLLIDVFTGANCLDELDVAVDTYHLQPDFLAVDSDLFVDEVLCSHLLKSNCPVTGQPDWASVFIAYRGKKIQHENLLKYIISFREHQDFHEHCVERMFVDIMQRCQPESLTVYARYTRRGGLDINPLRSTDVNPEPLVGRLLRQ